MEGTDRKVTITFISNFINHHQVNVADCLAASDGVDYKFVETMAAPAWILNSGYPDYSARPYLIKAYQGKEEMKKARRLIDDSDVVIIGSAPEEWVEKRLLNDKVTFHYSERWFKKGYHSLLSPRAWKSWYKYHTRFRNKRSYMLCASAYTACDVRKVFAYPNKCFKWGYFTKVDNLDFEENLEAPRGVSRLRILYISRFLIWKHPDLPIRLARMLKDRGIDFELNMYGTGEEQVNIECLISKLDVGDCVNLCGNKPNDELLKIIRQHHIFLFTSDRNEGWGAVLNEAMSNGCAVIASDAIGSVPFLIKDGYNGLKFKSENLADLFKKTMYLVDNPLERERLAKNAYIMMRDIWSPENAASSFIKLAKSALNNNIEPPAEGPCSYAD